MQVRLSKENQELAKSFIFQHGRPVERKLYAFHFDSGSPTDILAELAKFQNSDGGFGHALEPDLRTPVSTTIATTVGFQILRDIEVTDENALVREAVRFLLETYDADRKFWPIITREVNLHPHAPWWHYGDDRSSRWQEELANPRAEIIGYLFDYASLVPSDLRESLLADSILHFDFLPEQIEKHDLLCYARLVGTSSLPDKARQTLLERVVQAASKTMGKDAGQWAEYCLEPIEIVSSPDSLFASEFGDLMERYLDYAVDRQGDDGAWPLSWSWPGDEWENAEREWKGILTMRMLLTLIIGTTTSTGACGVINAPISSSFMRANHPGTAIWLLCQWISHQRAAIHSAGSFVALVEQRAGT